MRTIHLHSFALTALVFLAFTTNLAAESRDAGMLNAFEVQQLVKRAVPADNLRLAAHFNALRDRYTAEAKKHIAMSRSFAGNPNRNLGTGMSAHCKRLADLNTESATTVRELASYHQKLAAGNSATPPADAARFQGG